MVCVRARLSYPHLSFSIFNILLAFLTFFARDLRFLCSQFNTLKHCLLEQYTLGNSFHLYPRFSRQCRQSDSDLELAGIPCVWISKFTQKPGSKGNASMCNVSISRSMIRVFLQPGTSHSLEGLSALNSLYLCMVASFCLLYFDWIRIFSVQMVFNRRIDCVLRNGVIDNLHSILFFSFWVVLFINNSRCISLAGFAFIQCVSVLAFVYVLFLNTCLPFHR